MNRLLIVGILIISTAPLYAQAQPDPAKLKADAQKVVSIVSGENAKTQTFCQMAILGKAINEAVQEKDAEKAGELDQRIGELEKQLGPEYLARWSMPSETSTLTPRTVRRSCRYSIDPTTPVRSNTDSITRLILGRLVLCGGRVLAHPAAAHMRGCWKNQRSRTTKQAGCSSTDHGGGKRRFTITVVVCGGPLHWPR